MRKTLYDQSGLTFVEMLLSLAIIGIVFAAILPQFRAIMGNWDSKQGKAEVLQNGRVLMDHLHRNLSTAVRITAVSESSEANGYIEFQDNDGNNMRYDVDANSYVEFGAVGDLYELAGPVSQFQFTCYDACDLDTPMNPVVDPNFIRCVQVQTTLTNSASLGQNETFTIEAYIRTNGEASGECGGPVGWWKLDDGAGLTAIDSSGQGNDGTLTNMAGNEWTTGQVDGALEFDGDNDHIAGIGNCPTGNYTIAGWVKDTGPATGSSNWSVFYCADQEIWFGVDRGEYPALWLDAGGNNKGANMAPGTWTRDVWHHIAATWDGSTIHFYLDGVDMPITVYGTPENAQATVAAIGAWTKIGVEEVWYGIIDDVRIYDIALTAEEIASLAGVIYREVTESKAGSDATSVMISTPGGTGEGDLLITAVATDGDTSSTLTAPGGEGWTQISLNEYGNAVTLGVWWKNADASESPTHQFTWTGDETAYAWMMRFTGHDPDDPVNDWTGVGESTSNPTSPEVTTSVKDCLILRLGAFDDKDITMDVPGLSGHTAITMDTSNSGQVTYEGFTEDKTSPAVSLTIPTPSGVNEGDLLVAAVATDGDT
ncbi:MAG: LamG-like jellyroll fold domain-containing protein, partial [Planctomycetota bacterium]